MVRPRQFPGAARFVPKISHPFGTPRSGCEARPSAGTIKGMFAGDPETTDRLKYAAAGDATLPVRWLRLSHMEGLKDENLR